MEVLAFIEKVMAEAAVALVKEQARGLDIEVKRDTSLVTQADLASEKVIIDAISSSYPDDIIYSEEAGLSSQEREPGRHIWVIDPLDGTTNFANGYPFYCISVARGVLDASGRIDVLSAGIRDVPRARTYLAQKGKGAHVDGRPLHVSRDKQDLSSCFLVTGFYYTTGEPLSRDIGAFERVAQTCQSIRRDGAAALDLALVAEGVYDGFWERGLQPWDVAAGSLLVSEAGGVVGNYPQYAEGDYNIEGVGLIAGSASTVNHLGKLIDGAS